MPQPHTLKITEIFSSVQGEGLRQGEPTLFVRLTGCNLRCDFCDTKYAWEGGEKLSVEEIIKRVKRERQKFPAPWVCITGGEPLIQDLKGITEALKKMGMKIQIETNATHYQDLNVDWYTLSPKPPDYFFQSEYKKKAREVKLVVSQELDLEVIQKIRKSFSEKIPVILQPESNQKWSRDKGLNLLEESLRMGLKNIKVSLQLHKIYEIG
ncbi:MAG: 7-carboxy-7-deazaguanine synthase QueE [Acidobacteriota bacterium]